MRIYKLIVRKTNPNIEVIRDIKFNLEGLNLIVDNTINEPDKSGNNVGKTTVIKIIDICLGAKSIRDIYYDGDTKSSNTLIEKFLNDFKVQAELIVVNSENTFISIKRDLYKNGKKYINEGSEDKTYGKQAFWDALKKILFNSIEDLPTFRQLISKFVRISATSEDNIIKFLSGCVTNDTYDSIYSFLFGFLNKKDISEKSNLLDKLKEHEKSIEILQKLENISSISSLNQEKNIVENDLIKFNGIRNRLMNIEDLKKELENNRNLNIKINEKSQIIGELSFEIDLIKENIGKLKDDKDKINLSNLRNIYNEAKCFIPELDKRFEDLLNFHNNMIQNRINFISKQLEEKEELLDKLNIELADLMQKKEKISIEILDEEIYETLTNLNNNIEGLSKRKGEIDNSIEILEDLEKKKKELEESINKIDLEIDTEYIDSNIAVFNEIFSDYCDKLYGEKYYFDYNSKWREDKKAKFPYTIRSINGNVGTGKKKAVIIIFDLAYMKYSEIMKMAVPQFVIHDKLENTHINQLKAIFKICNNINGQFIIPILRERIDKIEDDIIKKATILELNSDDKFFKI